MKMIDFQNSWDSQEQTTRNILSQTAATKVPAKPSYDKFGKDTLNPPFSESLQRGDQMKLAEKVGQN